eukprot:UN04747
MYQTKNKWSWLFRGRIRQFVLWAPAITLQSHWVASAVRTIKRGVNRPLEPLEYIGTAYCGGVFSAVWSTPIDLLRAKQKISQNICYR